MIRDHRKLEAFQLCDRLVVQVYEATRSMPREELFGLTSQVRRAALSAPTNIVEGCARQGDREFAHFLSIAFGSLRETDYLLDVATRLGMLDSSVVSPVLELHDHACRLVASLMKSIAGP